LIETADERGKLPDHRLAREAAIGVPIKRVPIPDVLASRCSGLPILWFAAILLITTLSACAGVKPWERDTLSSPGMQVNAEPLISDADDHIYFSREASKGGRSYGGGGCGCN
jgi:hypothetical protein